VALFTIRNVCMGNICRSPMAERLLARAVQDRATDATDPLIRISSAGTGGWHEGEEMNPPAARQVRSRGGSVDGFEARKLRGDFIDEADLILTATADQTDYVIALRPDVAARTFVLGEFGRLLRSVDTAALPPAEPKPEALLARGVAIVTAVDRLRGQVPPLAVDDLDDPWGRGEQTFQRIGDEIEDVTVPFANLLLP
jgi:protein-tyrosine phosphatase